MTMHCRIFCQTPAAMLWLVGNLIGTKDMQRFRPKYVTFDCYGTLINFQMAEAASDLFGHLLDRPRMDEFIKNFSAYRLDEVMQDWKPYADVVHNALERTCR